MEFMVGVSQNWVANALAALAIAALAFWNKEKWIMQKTDEVNKHDRTVAAILIAPFVIASLLLLGFMLYLSMMMDFISSPDPLLRADLLYFAFLVAAMTVTAYSAGRLLVTAYQAIMLVVRKR